MRGQVCRTVETDLALRQTWNQHYSKLSTATFKNSLLPAELNMAPKGKAADKDKAAKGKGKDASADKGGGKQKGAQSINVRHILCEK